MKDDRLYLSHILDRIQRISVYTQGGRNAFLASLLIQDAVIRNFEVIGEAAKNISAELKAAYPDIPWRRIAGFRDVLIHNYVGVNVALIWNVITNDLPALAQQIEQVYARLDASP